MIKSKTVDKNNFTRRKRLFFFTTMTAFAFKSYFKNDRCKQSYALQGAAMQQQKRLDFRGISKLVYIYT